MKRWLLAKCLPGLFTPIQPFTRPRSSQRKRPVSPILFASRSEIDNEAGHSSAGDDFEDEHSDVDPDELVSSFYQEKYKYTPGPSSTAGNAQVIPTSTSINVGQYILLAFSTGQVLEDHNLLSWYSLKPHEFLELHWNNAIVRLPREEIEHYVVPYFEAKVWALKALAGSDDSEASRAAGGLGRTSEAGEAERDRTKKKKTKLQWHERWVVIRQGLFQLCAERDYDVSCMSVHFSLSSSSLFCTEPPIPPQRTPRFARLAKGGGVSPTHARSLVVFYVCIAPHLASRLTASWRQSRDGGETHCMRQVSRRRSFGREFHTMEERLKRCDDDRSPSQGQRGWTGLFVW